MLTIESLGPEGLWKVDHRVLDHDVSLELLSDKRALLELDGVFERDELLVQCIFGGDGLFDHVRALLDR